MEKVKIQPLATPKSLNRSSQKIGRRDYVLDGTRHAKFCSDRLRGFYSLNTWFCRAFGVTSMFVFLGSSIRLQPTPLDGYLRKIHQMTSFRVRKCLLGFSMTIFYIWTLKFPKKPPFRGPILTGQFFATENRFNMGILKYKLPLIVIVAA